MTHSKKRASVYGLIICQKVLTHRFTKTSKKMAWKFPAAKHKKSPLPEPCTRMHRLSFLTNLPPHLIQSLNLRYTPSCLLYTSDAADDLLCVDLGGRRI